MHAPSKTLPAALAWSHPFIRFLIVLNLLYAAGVGVMLAMTLIPGTFLWEALGLVPFPEEHRDRIVLGLRGVMALGIVAAGLVDRALRHLLAIVETVRAGDPFVADNARRLERIAWLALAGEGLRLLIGAVAWAATTGAIEIDMGYSLAPWLAVLLLFVLARVFAEGTRMRTDLEGTV